ncbi:PREDICTED: oligodendrocyte-myelin glycoprotein [Nanorana parkeri]|uniref:oligodendrocyte-myelin glycoprotein n=1 Tax=Nanorana parkeri TaxID=125878 RepID=UPI000854056E|nr:PREDICTED: oligodendrocyte-myelin glycoprotein [Nanorana parkeri]XP_018425840.1 PREDICTED: oligodendrocyte-myelin glycoprotein [Nanorana parkeri]
MDYQIKPSPGLLILLCSVPNIFCLCPLKCTCIMKNRNVDCSASSLTALPHGLQDNIIHLNLSFNQLSNIDHQLTRFTNLRFIDLSHNLLNHLPSHLPRSLWALYASNNSIKVLHKLDTAYQWNLKVLDISKNSLQRTVFINNTLISLQLLNLSYNQLWTVPTNMPSNILTIDLSNNSLIQILPGTLMRMPKLQKLYLHNNRFTYIPTNALDHLTHLIEITLYNNPWSCKDMQDMNYVMTWVEENNNVIGSPCAKERYKFTKQFSTEYEAQSEVTTDNIPLFTTSHSLLLEVQEPKRYKNVQYPEDLTAAPVNTSSILHASTEDSVMIDENSADGMIHLEFNTFGNEIDNQMNSNEMQETNLYDSTVIVSFDNILNNDNNLTLPSTTVSVEIQATTVQLNDHAPSSAVQKEKCTAIPFFIIFLVLRTV